MNQQDYAKVLNPVFEAIEICRAQVPPHSRARQRLDIMQDQVVLFASDIGLRLNTFFDDPKPAKEHPADGTPSPTDG